MSTHREWDDEYRVGAWDVLRTELERPRYRALATRVSGANTGAPRRILDLGCGTGVLRSHLETGSVESYTGVDWSAEAVKEAHRGGHARSSFHVASIVDWEPDDRYDAIVFNEVLYYLPEPVAVAERYSAYLSDAGSLLVSMWCPSTVQDRRPAKPSILRARLGLWRIWRALGRRFDVVHDTVAQTSALRRWRIQELRAPEPPSP
jgi:2-polyprenyl-3-methyl-5-hydroxy-6-metoxy-1,4-benzoquinol methylase